MGWSSVWIAGAIVVTATSIAAADTTPPSAPGGPAGKMRDARTGFTATLLDDGRVLVVGGHGGHGEFGTNLRTAEI